MLKFRIFLDPKPVIKNLDNFKAKINTGLGKIADRWGAEVVSHIKDSYLSGPRPQKLGTITGHLRSSIRFKISENENTMAVAFGTDVPYAAIHEYGGQTPPRVIKPKEKGGVLSFLIGGRRVFAKSVQHPGSKIKSRPFMKPGVNDKFSSFKETIAAFLREAANGNA